MALFPTFATAAKPGPASALPDNAGFARIGPHHRYAAYVFAKGAVGLFSGYQLPSVPHYDRLKAPPVRMAKGGFLLKNISLRRQATGSGARSSCGMRF